MENNVYVVIAHRFGNVELYSYIVGVFTTLHQAKYSAKLEREYRGTKYECKVYLVPLNSNKFKENNVVYSTKILKRYKIIKKMKL